MSRKLRFYDTIIIFRKLFNSDESIVSWKSWLKISMWYSFWKTNIKTRKKDLYREDRARYTNRTRTKNFHLFQLWRKYRKLWIKILKSMLFFLFITQTSRILFIIQTIRNTYFEMSNLIYLSFKRRFKLSDISRYFCFSNTFNDRTQLHIQEIKESRKSHF